MATFSEFLHSAEDWIQPERAGWHVLSHVNIKRVFVSSFNCRQCSGHRRKESRLALSMSASATEDERVLSNCAIGAYYFPVLVVSASARHWPLFSLSKPAPGGVDVPSPEKHR
eukprot:gene17862-21343_t